MNRILYWLTGDARMLSVETLHHMGIEGRFPGWVTLFAIIAVIALAVFLYRKAPGLSRRQRLILTTLRACAYAAMLFMLAAPVLKIEGEGRPSGPLPVVVDRTESMGIADKPGGSSRLDKARIVARALRDAASGVPALQQVPYLYGDDVVSMPLPDKPGATNAMTIAGTRTSIRAMLDGAFRDHRGGYCPGILLLTDGANNVPDSLDASIDDLARRQTPVYAVALGRADAPDISLDQLLGDDIAFVNEKVKFFVNARQFGFAGKPLNLKVTLGNVPVPLPELTPERDGEWSFPVEVTPREEGIKELVVEAIPDGRELTAKNNTVKRKVRVIRDRIRVLMVFGQPSWEYRYLNGAFERDRRVQHKIFLQNLDKQVLKGGAAGFLATLPATRDELFRQFDIVMLGRVDIRTLPKGFIPLLRDFVSEDGGSMVIHGDGADLPYSFSGSVLAPLLPVRLLAPMGENTFAQEIFKPLDTPYRLELGEEGQGHPLVTFDPNPAENRKIWSRFVPLFDLATQVELKPSAIPLIQAWSDEKGPRIPAIAYHTYGRGAVLYMGFDSTWRWRKVYGDRYFRDYWGKVVQFLGLPHLLRESAQARLIPDRLEVAMNERVMLTGMIRNRDFSPHLAESIEVLAKNEAGGEIHVKLDGSADRPGIFRGSFYPDSDGRWLLRLPAEYQAEPVELTALKINREFVDSALHLALLNDLAEKTGGAVFVPAELSATLRPYEGKFGAEARRRSDELSKDRAVLERAGRDCFADAAYMTKFARQLLATIAEQRPRQPVTFERTLWDWAGMLIIAALLLCIEYLLRKLWYLD